MLKQSSLEIYQRQFVTPFDSLPKRRSLVTFSTSSDDNPWKRREEWIKKPRPSENPGEISSHHPDPYIDLRDTEIKDSGSTQPTPQPPKPDKK